MGGPLVGLKLVLRSPMQGAFLVEQFGKFAAFEPMRFKESITILEEALFFCKGGFCVVQVADCVFQVTLEFG